MLEIKQGQDMVRVAVQRPHSRAGVEGGTGVGVKDTMGPWPPEKWPKR